MAAVIVHQIVEGEEIMNQEDKGRSLAEMIKKAIEDGKLTTGEYDRILAMANADKIIDSYERSLLTELQELLANKTVIKVAE
ncbi:MAG TPA: hypothetical protein PLR43_06535 [Syntrophales bacterium]|nr:hypothetical protein [Syntrophales bacterium]